MSNGDACYYDQFVVDTLSGSDDLAPPPGGPPHPRPADPRVKVAEQYLNTCRNSNTSTAGAVVNLPLGAWNGHLNGYPVTILFHYVDQGGQVYGFVDEQSTGIYRIINASWNDSQKVLTFTRQLPTVPSEPTQNYTGYLFTGPEASQTPTLAGTFTRPDGSTGGWYAIYTGGIPDRMI
jgi:hypothetical protein